MNSEVTIIAGIKKRGFAGDDLLGRGISPLEELRKEDLALILLVSEKAFKVEDVSLALL